MTTLNIIESKLWNCVVIIFTCFIIRALQKLDGFLLFFFVWEDFYVTFPIIVGNFIIVILTTLYIWSFEYDIYLLVKLIPGCTVMPVVIVVNYYIYLCSSEQTRLRPLLEWYPWIPVLMIVSIPIFPLRSHYLVCSKNSS